MNKTIGAKIKQLRLSQNMKLKDLSDKTGLSISYLSQIEHSSNSLSIYSLERIANVLGVQLSYFLDTPLQHKEYIIRSYEQDMLQISNSPRIYNRLSNDLGSCELESMLVTIMPSERYISEEPKAHQGEEFIYVLEGVLTVLIGESEYQLTHGDSMHYKSSEPHEWLNLSKRVVRLLSVNTPRPWSMKQSY